MQLRPIPRVGIRDDVYEKHQKNILEVVGAHKMVGLLKQIGQLSEYAGNIFQTLFKESQGSLARIQRVTDRVGGLEHSLGGVENTMYNKPPAAFYAHQAKGGKAWRRRDEFSQSLFIPQTQPEPVKAMRDYVAPPPRVWLLNEVTGKNCLAAYSDPQFFLMEWLKAEEERQRVLKAEADARKAEKRKMKKSRRKQQRQVEAVDVKKYTATGELIKQEKKAKAVAKPGEAEEPETEEPEEDFSTSGYKAPTMPVYAPPTQSAPRPQAPGGPGGPTGAPVPPPYVPSSGTAPTAPSFAAPPMAPAFNAPAAPAFNAPAAPAFDAPAAPAFVPPPAPAFDVPAAPAFDVPDAPSFSVPDAPNFSAPEAPGAPGDIPSIPSVPDEPAETFTAPSASGLLGEIQKGRKLKAATARPPVEKRPPDARSGMLDEIRSKNFALKKVEPKKEDEKPKAAAGGGLSSIMDILARRSAIENSDDEAGSDDDEWD